MYRHTELRFCMPVALFRLSQMCWYDSPSDHHSKIFDAYGSNFDFLFLLFARFTRLPFDWFEIHKNYNSKFATNSSCFDFKKRDFSSLFNFVLRVRESFFNMVELQVRPTPAAELAKVRTPLRRRYSLIFRHGMSESPLGARRVKDETYLDN